MNGVRIPWARPTLLGNEKQYVLEALNSTWISSGEFVERFEKAFLDFHGSPHGVTASSGTAALQLALSALSIGEGDEVIVPGYTFVAPVNMVLAQRARPVFVDIDPRTWCIDTDKIEGNITGKTKAIVAVHIYGNVCDMGNIRRIAGRHGLFVVEDAAQAIFSRYRGGLAGTFGDAGCFSFQATKTVTTGEGGFVLAKQAPVLDRCRKIRDHGMAPQKRYWHDCLGFNFRLTNLQAALGCAQMENAARIVEDKKRIASRYRSALSGVPGITLQKFLPEVDPVVWSTVIKLGAAAFKGDRDFVLAALREKGIECRPGFYSFSQMPMYDAPQLAVAEDVGRNCLSLPSYSTIKNEEIDHVCRCLLQLLVSNEIKV